MDERDFETNNAVAAQMATAAMADRHRAGLALVAVNDERLYEGQVAAYVEQFRRRAGLAAPAAWRRWLSEKGRTEADVFDETASYLVNFILMNQAAAQRGISASKNDVDLQVECAWTRAGGIPGLVVELERRGMDMREYRDGIATCIARKRLVDDVASLVEEPLDLEALIYLKNKGAIEREATFADLSDDDIAAARAALLEERKNEAFDKWFAQYRESARIVRIDNGLRAG